MCGSPAPEARSFIPGKSGCACPDLVDLIKEVTPVVVNIRIRRHMLQQSSAAPPPLGGSRGPWQAGGGLPQDHTELGSQASGFIADERGYIVTNAHVVEGATRIVVTLWNGNDYEAEILRIHPRVDLALLKIRPPRGLHKARLGNSSSLEVGEWVLAVGNPFGLGKTVTAGIVSGKGRYIGLGPDDDFIQTDASINPGNSGGPLFDMNGKVVGVNTAIIAAGKGIGFSIPANYINELLKSPSRMRAPSRGWLGIYVEEMTEKQAKERGFPEPRGTFVGEVLKSGPAFNAGLQSGDLILQANSENIRNGRHLSRILAGLEPGKVLRITILRGNRARTLDVVVGKSPE